MRVILIEDNPQVREMLKSLIERYFPHMVVVGESESVADGIRLINSVGSDICILDVELRDGSVFELLDRVDQDVLESTSLIFLTAFGTYDYVVRAMRKSAVDFLLKPVNPSEFTAAITRANEEINRKSQHNRIEELKNLLKSELSVRIPPRPDRLPVFMAKGAVRYIAVEEIICLEGDNNVTKVYTVEEKPVMSVKNLGFYTDLLVDQYAFVAISKRHLVNSRYISRYDPVDGAVDLTDGTRILTSRRGGRQLLDFFRNVFR
jgi:two-component system LytT family response regulator